MATREERLRRMDEIMGAPFVQLPGCPPQHKVMGFLRSFTADGHPIRVRDVEMVFNDALLMDTVDDEGSYVANVVAKSAPAGEVLELAEKLYGMHLAEARRHWLTLPRGKGLEWPGKALA